MCQARAVECNELKEPSTMEITTVGLQPLISLRRCGGLVVA
jgi:hypothetical protein